MRKILLVLLAIVFVGAQESYAQKNQREDHDFRKAESLFSNNDLEGAFNAINKFLADYPYTADGYFLRSRIYLEQEKYSKAIVDLTRALEHITKDDQHPKYRLHWWRATAYRHLQDYDKAIEDYKKAYSLIKNQDNELISDILVQCAEVYAKKAEYKNEMKTYFLMLKHNDKDQMAMAGIARLFLNNGLYDDVIDISNRSEKCDQLYAGIYLFRMQAYSKLGKKEAAIDDAVKYLITSKKPDYTIVDAIFKQHLNYAVVSMVELCNTDRKNFAWNDILIELYKANFDYISAIKKYNEYEREHGPSIYTYAGRSECYAAIGYPEYAIDCIDKCLEVAEKDDIFRLLSARAHYCFEAGQYDDAIACLDLLINAEPRISGLYELRGWCYQLKEDYNAAMKDYNMGVDVDKTNASLFVKRGMLRFRLGHKSEAAADFKHVLDIDTKPALGSARHYALLMTGSRNEALDWANKIIAIQPNNAGLYYDKACLLSLMKSPAQAIDALRKAFEKGYRTFAHIANDDDLDYIRNDKGFIALVEEYKAKPIVVNDYVEPKPIEDEIPDHFEIPMKKNAGGTYEVACQINSVPLRLTFDTGAANVTISLAEARFMYKNGYLKDSDFKGTVYHSIANGEIVEGTRVVLREIRIGDAVLRDIEASVIHNQEASLLLGQSVLERFGTVTIDNVNSKIIIRK